MVVVVVVMLAMAFDVVVLMVLLYFLVVARPVDPVPLLQLQEWKWKENLLAPALDDHRST